MSGMEDEVGSNDLRSAKRHGMVWQAHRAQPSEYTFNCPMNLKAGHTSTIS